MRLTLLLLLFPALLTAQVPDSVKRDSVLVRVSPPAKSYWQVRIKAWYTVEHTDTVRVPIAGVDTVRIVDTLYKVRTDTVYKTRVDTVVVVKVRVDTVYVLGSGPATIGIPFGVYQFPSDSLCKQETLAFNATTLSTGEANFPAKLQRVKECGGTAFIQIPRLKAIETGAGLSVRASTAEWLRVMPTVCPMFTLGYAYAHIGDDIADDAAWGPAPYLTRLARYDSIAGNIKSMCSTAQTTIRARAVQLKGIVWKNLDAAWAQYIGPRPSRGQGTAVEFAAAEVAAAKALKLGIVLGLNVLNAGCGPSTTGWCQPGVAGVNIPGSETGYYQMSAAEYLRDKRTFINALYACATVDWTWASGSVRAQRFHDRPEVAANSLILAEAAALRPATRCNQR